MSNAERGRQLVQQTGKYQQETMIDTLDVLEWLRENREQRDRTGCCPGGCNRQQIPHLHGYAVCPMTYEPCQKRRLDLILKQLGMINGSDRK